MSPRSYQAGPRRQQATEAPRSRIIAAARDLLADPGTPMFTVDAVAERADVARMTVYYQFKSKGKLLEALFDDLAARANMREMRKAFQEPDPVRGIDTLIDVFSHLWETQRAVIRRVTALAAFDPEVNAALSERGRWRPDAIAALLQRLPPRANAEDTLALLNVLTSFETYDALATPQRPRKQVVLMLQRAATQLLGT